MATIVCYASSDGRVVASWRVDTSALQQAKDALADLIGSYYGIFEWDDQKEGSRQRYIRLFLKQVRGGYGPWRRPIRRQI